VAFSQISMQNQCGNKDWSAHPVEPEVQLGSSTEVNCEYIYEAVEEGPCLTAWAWSTACHSCHVLALAIWTWKQNTEPCWPNCDNWMPAGCLSQCDNEPEIYDEIIFLVLINWYGLLLIMHWHNTQVYSPWYL